MRPLQLTEVARLAGGRLVGDDRTIDAIATDTRTLAPVARAPHPGPLPQAGEGEKRLFVALKGENFDGHDHVDAAASAGVAAALVSREIDAGLPQVVVADTERALASLAAGMQRTRPAKVAAITGSNGKTSVKSLLLSILQAAGDGAYANPGNRNNEIGLPLAVLDAPEDARFAVYEMGAGKPGDIAYLTTVVRPGVAIVNNIAPAHLERMGSLLAVADTKAAIYDALPPDGVAVINADDAFAPYFAERAHGRRLIRFGLEASADVTARDLAADGEGSSFVLVTPDGEATVTLAMPGRHNVANALAAAAMALGLGVGLEPIVRGLDAARPVAGRLVTHALGDGVVLVDDSYNANPGSLAAAIDTLATAPGEGWLVLGDMRELGVDAEAMHAEAGRRAKSMGLVRLFALGPLSAAAARAFGEGGAEYGNHDELIQALRKHLASVSEKSIRILVKGSRGSAMDKVVAALLPGTQGGDDAA